MSRIGIIILHWHNAELVNMLLDDMQQWTDDWTKIVVDNSGDYAPEKQFPSLLVLKPGTNLGFAGGCNLGMQRAFELDCQFILLLNADVSIRESDVVALENQLSARSELAAVGPILKERHKSEFTYHKGGTNPLIHSNTRLVHNAMDGSAMEISYLPGTVLLMRRAALQDVGLFDENYFFSGEVADWFLRLQATNWKFALHEHVLVEHFNTGNSAYRQKHYIYYSLRNRYLLIDKFGKDNAKKLAKVWTWKLRRQMLGAILRFDFNKFATIYLAARDGVKGNFNQSSKFS